MSEHIDKIFREKLGRHKASVSSTPDIWAAIAADQARKRKRAIRITYAKYTGILLMLLAIAWSSYNYFAPDENIIATPATSANQSTSLTTANNTATTTSSEPANSTPAVNTKSATNSSAIPTASTIVNSATNNVLIERRNEVQISNNSAIANSPTVNTVIDDNSLSGQSQGIVKENEKNVEATTEDIPVAALSARADDIMGTSLLPVLPLPILSPRVSALSLPAVNEIDQQLTSFKRNQKQRLEVDILAGPAYANQVFGLEDEANRDLLSAREISEFPTVSFLAGVRVSYRIKQRWSIRTGLLYTQIRNQFEYEQLGITPDDPTILIKSSNQIRLLEIPVLASYTLPGKRFRLAINAGPVLNVSTSANGRYLLPDLMEPVNLKDDNIYRSNIGLGFQASLTAAYDLGQGNSLLIEPTFKSYRSNFTHRDYALNERYWLAGLQLGLRHRLR